MAIVDTKEDDDDDEVLVYVKKSQKREWLKDMLENKARDDMTSFLETLDAAYEDVESLKSLDVMNTM